MKDVIYSSEIEATKITADWYLWIHHTIDKIPNDKLDKNMNGKKTLRKQKPVQKKNIILLK